VSAVRRYYFWYIYGARIGSKCLPFRLLFKNQLVANPLTWRKSATRDAMIAVPLRYGNSRRQLQPRHWGFDRSQICRLDATKVCWL